MMHARSNIMELREFVSASLLQIVQGVADSATEISRLGGAVSPAFHPNPTNNLLGRLKSDASTPVYAVEFDVAVVASSTMGAEGGAKLQVATILSIGGKGSGSEKDETTSRIKFSVPLSLPVDLVSREAGERREREIAQRAEDAIRSKNPPSGPQGWMGN
jgi:hypothetical protein